MKIAVIGVGHLGKHHARILSALPGVRLTAVADVNRGRADEIASVNGTKAVYDYREVIEPNPGAGDPGGKVDAVTIAVPTELHAEIGCACLEAGVAVLV